MRGIVVSSIAVLVFVGAISFASAQVSLQEAQLDTPGVASPTLHLPEAAADAHAISLGSAVDPISGKVVEGYALFHHREGHNGGPPGGGDDNGGSGGDSQCYAVFAKDAEWKVVEPWMLNPSNDEGLADDYLLSNLSNDIAKWENAASDNILGDGALTNAVLSADTDAPDGVNEVYFADISSSGAIGVTIVWGVFTGPPPFRELVEWDQVYDDVDFDWSSTGEAGKMDFENIATHELGHTVGLGHPDDSCTEETMYRFATKGETKKRTLEAGDIAGVNELY